MEVETIKVEDPIETKVSTYGTLKGQSNRFTKNAKPPLELRESYIASPLLGNFNVTEFVDKDDEDKNPFKNPFEDSPLTKTTLRKSTLSRVSSQSSVKEKTKTKKAATSTFSPSTSSFHTKDRPRSAVSQTSETPTRPTSALYDEQGGWTQKHRYELQRQKRENIVSYINSLNVEDAKTKFQKELDAQKSAYETHIAQINQELDNWKWNATKEKEEVAQLEEQLNSLKHVNDMLRKKLHKLAERDLEHQRKLKAFSHLEPVFEKLGDTFELTTPEEIVDRFERMERAQVEQYNELLEVRERKIAVEKEVAILKEEKEDALQNQYAELQKLVQRETRQNSELQSELEYKNKIIEKQQEATEKYLQLSTELMALWHKWAGSELVERMEAWQKPDPSDPAQIINAINTYFTLHSPSATAHTLRSLNGFANSIWLKYFKDNMTIKGRSREIFAQLAVTLDKANLENEKLKAIISKLKDENKQLKASMEETHRSEARIKTELDLLKKTLDKKHRGESHSNGTSTKKLVDSLVYP